MGHSHLSTSHQGKDITPDLPQTASPRASLSQWLENEETSSQFQQVSAHTISISALLLTPTEIQNLHYSSMSSYMKFLKVPLHLLQTLEMLSRSTLENVLRIRFPSSSKVLTELMVVSDQKPPAKKVGQTPKKERQGCDQSL